MQQHRVLVEIAVGDDPSRQRIERIMLKNGEHAPRAKDATDITRKSHTIRYRYVMEDADGGSCIEACCRIREI